MTTPDTLTETVWANDRTVIDSRSLRDESRFTRPPPRRLSRVLRSSHRTAFGFAGLGLAVIAVAVFAVREHREANALREALRNLEPLHVYNEPRRVGSERADDPQTVSLTTLPSVPPVIGDRVAAERRAADFMVANNYGAALGQYRSLLHQFPGERVYADLIVALRWRLECDRPRPVGGHPCNGLF